MGKKPYFDPKEAALKQKAEMKEIIKKLEKGVEDVFTSENFKNFLNTMARFPHYSYNNSILIMLQKPDATLVQSYTGWKKMGRYVKKNEKGIRIIAPAPFKYEKEVEKTDDNSMVINQDGDLVREKETITIKLMAYKPVSTFDISQTEGKPVPQLDVKELIGTVEDYKNLFKAIKLVSPVPIEFEDIKTGSKGYFHTTENRIAIKTDMSEVQTVKTAIHEMTHATLHNLDAQKDNKQSRNSMEVEAESIAYTVCQHYGIDTSDYSFSYVASWSQGKELPELKESLQTIQATASYLITKIDEQMQELTKEKPFDFFVSEFGEFEEIDDNQHGFTLMQRINMYYSQLIKNADKDKANTQNIDNTKNELEL